MSTTSTKKNSSLNRKVKSESSSSDGKQQKSSFLSKTGISNMIANIKGESMCFVIIDCDNTRESYLMSKFYSMLVNLFWDDQVVKHHFIVPKPRLTRKSYDDDDDDDDDVKDGKTSTLTMPTADEKEEKEISQFYDFDEIASNYPLECLRTFSYTVIPPGKKRIINVVFCINNVMNRRDNLRGFLESCTRNLQNLIRSYHKEWSAGPCKIMYELFVDPSLTKEEKSGLIAKLPPVLFSSSVHFGERFDVFCETFLKGINLDDLFGYHDMFNFYPPLSVTLTLKQRPIDDYVAKQTMRIVKNVEGGDAESGAKKKKQISRCPYCNKLEENVQNRNATKEHENNCSFNISPMTIKKGREKEKIVKRTIIILVIGESGKSRSDVFRDCFELDSLTNDKGSTDYYVTTIEILEEKDYKSMKDVNKYLAELIPETSLTAMRRKGKKTHQKPAAIGIESLFVFCDQGLIKDGKELVDFPGGVHAVHYNVSLTQFSSTLSEKEKTFGMNDSKFLYDQNLWLKNIQSNEIVKQCPTLGTMFVFLDIYSFILNMDWYIELTKAHHFWTRFSNVPYYYETDCQICDIDQFSSKFFSKVIPVQDQGASSTTSTTSVSDPIINPKLIQAFIEKRKAINDEIERERASKAIKLEPKDDKV